ncbi:ketopantoate reductase family protein [Sneathiella limimaris]|uniref:ketopantoate reductase family protein n=1 Tax=Sneathiella limimaris TaxID=1964213 RepID=UPI00146A1A73|nr:2-dehydropantoate 2-reductase [Sneathiella limimaris]
MKIAVMGAGGIGGYFGGRLAARFPDDVTFIARGAHMQAMKDRGLELKSVLGDTLISPVQVTDNTAEVGPVDVIMFAVKLYDIDAALEQIRPMVGPDTAIISLQNGIWTEDRIAEVYSPQNAVGGIAYAPIAIESPGVIRHEGNFASISFGELNGEKSARLDEFSDMCAKAGVDALYTTKIKQSLWKKFVFLASFAGITATTRQKVAYLQSEELAMDLFQQAITEAVAVAAAEGVTLDEDVVESTVKMTAGMAPSAQSSMLTDFEAGKPLEVNWFSGEIVRRGQKHGVRTPVHQAFYVAMKPFAAGQ